uniref:Uncharacterized protein n=1 Tax=Cucumis melo TaxID=3656 RepID=A0A9I9DBH1_CUCME
MSPTLWFANFITITGFRMNEVHQNKPHLYVAVKKHANEWERIQFQDNKACLSSEDNETASVHVLGKLGYGRVKRHYPLDEQNMLLQPNIPILTPGKRGKIEKKTE